MGSSPDNGLPDEFSHDVLGTETSAGSTSTLKGLGKAVTPALEVESATSTKVFIGTNSLEALSAFTASLSDYNSNNYIVYVVSGPGEGQSKQILRITSTFIDIEGSFSISLTNQSVIVIRDGSTVSSFEDVGEPSRMFSTNSITTRMGVNYDAQYQLEVLASNQEQVLFLYAVIKTILISQTYFLESQGIQSLKLSGSDFSPKSEYLPTDVFCRAMTLNFVYAFSFVEEFANPSRIDVIILPNDEFEIPIASINL